MKYDHHLFDLMYISTSNCTWMWAIKPISTAWLWFKKKKKNTAGGLRKPHFPSAYAFMWTVNLSWLYFKHSWKGSSCSTNKSSQTRTRSLPSLSRDVSTVSKVTEEKQYVVWQAAWVTALHFAKWEWLICRGWGRGIAECCEARMILTGFACLPSCRREDGWEGVEGE